MPELPEVETIVRQLRPEVSGQQLLELAVYDEKLGLRGNELSPGLTVADVARSGKQIIFHLRGTKAQRFIAVHLRMSGCLIWRPHAAAAAGSGRLPARESLRSKLDSAVTKLFISTAESIPYVRAIFRFPRGAIYFVDPRRFGTIKVGFTAADFSPPGRDPLDSSFTPAVLRDMLGGSGQEIKAFLMRQDRITGIGNIYASEILFGARIHPQRRAGSLGASEAVKLHREMRRVLFRAVEACGTTFSSYHNAAGEAGGYQRYLKVYDREGKPCRRCATPVARIAQQGRSTYYCAVCQPAGAAALNAALTRKQRRKA